MTTYLAPGPRRFTERMGAIYNFSRNYLIGYQYAFEKYGDVIYFEYPEPRLSFCHPEHAKELLKGQASALHKSKDYVELEPMLGQGLLNSEDEQWRRDRRLVGPEFHLKRVQEFHPIFVSHTQRLLESWRERGEVDFHEEMTELTLSIVGEALFGARVGHLSSRVGELVGLEQELAIKRLMPMPFTNPGIVRWAQDRKRAARLSELDEIVYSLIDNPKGDGNLIARLLRARDPETGEKLTRTQLRDQVTTLFIAGHETTANALAWTLYLLGLNPQWWSALQEEVESVCRSGPPTPEHLDELKLTQNILKESMRVFNPVALVSRQNIRPIEVAGIEIPTHTNLDVVQWFLHRHRDYWERPEEFDPLRFEKPLSHSWAYLPFGGGPRECIGKQFAMQEMMVVLTMIAQNLPGFSLLTKRVEPEPLITVRPKGGVHAKLHSNH